MNSLNIKCRGHKGEIFIGAKIWGDRYFDNGNTMKCGPMTVTGFDAGNGAGHEVVKVDSAIEGVTEISARDIQSVYSTGK